MTHRLWKGKRHTKPPSKTSYKTTETGSNTKPTTPTSTPTLEEQEISTPLAEIYHSIGVHEYIEEVQKKKFFEKLLSKERRRKRA